MQEDSGFNMVDWSDLVDYSSSNGSDEVYELKEPCPLSSNASVEAALRLYLHPLICLLGFTGNSLVVLTYAFHKRHRSPTDVYLLNVAASDLLLVAALPLLTYNEQWAWPMGTVACKLLRGAYSINLYSGMLLLACISGDRYLAIVHGAHHRRSRLRTPLGSRAVCGAVWLLALCCSLPTLLLSQRYRLAHSEEPSYVCSLRFSDKATAHAVKVLVPAGQMALGFLLPLAVMAFCYACVVRTLLRGARGFQRHRAVRVVLAVVAVFLVCHLPYNVALLYHTLGVAGQGSQPCSTADALHVALTLTESLAYLHCCLNPLLYAFLGVKFRSQLKEALQELCCMAARRRRRSRRSSPHSLSSRATTSDSYASSSRRSLSSTSFTI